jgi:hypothetical protein
MFLAQQMEGKQQGHVRFVIQDCYTDKVVAYWETEVQLHSFSRSSLDRSNPIHVIKVCEEVEVYLHSFVIAEQEWGDAMHVVRVKV